MRDLTAGNLWLVPNRVHWLAGEGSAAESAPRHKGGHGETDQVDHGRRPLATREVHDYRASKQQHRTRSSQRHQNRRDAEREGSGAEVSKLSRLVAPSRFLIGGMTAVPRGCRHPVRLLGGLRLPGMRLPDPLLCLAAQPPAPRPITRLKHRLWPR